MKTGLSFLPDISYSKLLCFRPISHLKYSFFGGGHRKWELKLTFFLWYFPGCSTPLDEKMRLPCWVSLGLYQKSLDHTYVRLLLGLSLCLFDLFISLYIKATPAHLLQLAELDTRESEFSLPVFKIVWVTLDYCDYYINVSVFCFVLLTFWKRLPAFQFGLCWIHRWIWGEGRASFVTPNLKSMNCISPLFQLTKISFKSSPSPFRPQCLAWLIGFY